tara:strand:+ start:10009 stop:10677 length:669 start_codon:yes stop_codon:yes gene_type:complete
MFNYVGPAKPLTEVSSRTLDEGRFYKIDDKWMPSVTTVVGHQSKAGILEWQDRVGFAKAEQIRRSSAWRGTQYHNLVEHYLKNELEEVEKSEGLPTYLFRAARETLDRISNIHCIEAPLFSRRLGIAGRVDCIAEFDSELSIIDFKTTKQLKKVEHLEKFFVQEAAYAYMYYELTGVEVDKLVTLSVAEDGSVQVEQRYDKVEYIDTLIDWITEYHESLNAA